MKKEKRHSIRETMKKNLRKEYFYLKKELLFYCPIDLGTFSTETYYATFDKEGISIYQYDKSAESKLKLCERHAWSNWRKVKIDHYLTTSRFIFQGKRNWILSLFHKGKDAQKIIEEHTSLQTEVVSRSFFKKTTRLSFECNIKSIHRQYLLYRTYCIFIKMAYPISSTNCPVLFFNWVHASRFVMPYNRFN